MHKKFQLCSSNSFRVINEKVCGGGKWASMPESRTSSAHIPQPRESGTLRESTLRESVIAHPRIAGIGHTAGKYYAGIGQGTPPAPRDSGTARPCTAGIRHSPTPAWNRVQCWSLHAGFRHVTSATSQGLGTMP